MLNKAERKELRRMLDVREQSEPHNLRLFGFSVRALLDAADALDAAQARIAELEGALQAVVKFRKDQPWTGLADSKNYDPDPMRLVRAALSAGRTEAAP